MLKSLLQSFHLNAKETKIFRALMEEGVQPASAMARCVKMPRNTVRTILDGLVQRGLVAKSLKANTQYYRVAKTRDIIRFLEAQHSQASDRTETQIDLLQQMGESLGGADAPAVMVFEGGDAMEYVKDFSQSATCLHESDELCIYTLESMAALYMPKEKRVVQIASADLVSALPNLSQATAKKVPVVSSKGAKKDSLADIPPSPEQQSLL